jgi:hypothetical protein
LRKRIAAIGRQNIGQQYKLNLLGEFPYQLHDTLPMFSLEQSDCVVFAEHTYAMALSQSWEEFFWMLQRIRYKDGVVGVATRAEALPPAPSSAGWKPALAGRRRIVRSAGGSVPAVRPRPTMPLWLMASARPRRRGGQRDCSLSPPRPRPPACRHPRPLRVGSVRIEQKIGPVACFGTPARYGIAGATSQLRQPASAIQITVAVDVAHAPAIHGVGQQLGMVRIDSGVDGRDETRQPHHQPLGAVVLF